MPRVSAGVLLYRSRPNGLEVLLVHPGGPFWRHRDRGAWSIPKGEVERGAEAWQTARRELREETGLEMEGEAIQLEPIHQKGGKIVYTWMVEASRAEARPGKSTFSLRWPPGSTRTREFPEVDRVAWFGVEEARSKILAGQEGLLDQLLRELRKGRIQRNVPGHGNEEG